MQIQVFNFTNGGFVMHKIPTPSGKNKISAWFDDKGVMTSGERFDCRDRSYDIKKDSPLWGHAAKFGAREFAAKQKTH